jgi:Protein of unknown function (DUF2829)
MTKYLYTESTVNKFPDDVLSFINTNHSDTGEEVVNVVFISLYGVYKILWRKEIVGQDFKWACEQLRNGKTVRRIGWTRSESVLFLDIGGSIMFYNSQGNWMDWRFDLTDSLATDWVYFSNPDK